MREPAPSLADYQQAFAQFLLTPTPETLRRESLQPWLPAGDARVEQALSVYRNNVLYSLTQALAAQFPVVCRLVGKEFFNGLAREFVCEQPPVQPTLTFYGDGFAAFIAAHAACKFAPYLADVACLELACQYALHAADSPTLQVTDLMALPPEQLCDCTLSLHESVTLLQSQWPVHSIYDENHKPCPAVVSLDSDCSHYLLVYRHRDETQVVSLQAPAWCLLHALQRRVTLQTAWERVQANFAVPDDELVPLLVYLLKLEVFTQLNGELI